MLWATRGHLHLDRVATAWLILRFVDLHAEFVFVSDLDGVPAGAIPFGLPGVELSSHDENGTTFKKTLRAHGLSEPSLDLVERMVADGVRHALGRASEEPEPELWALAAALDGIGVGMGALFEDDHRLLSAALSLYDAVYVLSQVWTLPAEQREAVPAGPPAVRSGYLRQHLRMPRDDDR